MKSTRFHDHEICWIPWNLPDSTMKSAGFHEIHWISWPWNPLDSTMKSGRFHGHEIHQITPWNLVDFMMPNEPGTNGPIFWTLHLSLELLCSIVHIGVLIVWWNIPCIFTNSMLDLQGSTWYMDLLCCVTWGLNLDLVVFVFDFHYLDSWFILTDWNSVEIASSFHVWCSNWTFTVHFGTFWNKGGKLDIKQGPKLKPSYRWTLQPKPSYLAKPVSQKQWAVQQCSHAQWLHN